MQFYPTLDADSMREYLPAIPFLLPASSWGRLPRRADGALPVPRIPPQVPALAADCGGYVASLRAKRLGLEDGYTYTPEQYLAWLEALGPRLSWAATFDWCCEPPVAGSRVLIRQRQHKTTEMAWHFWGQHKYCQFAWVPTIQGWDIADYVWHARQLQPLIQEMASFYGAHRGWRVGIGTLCQRASIPMIQAVCAAVSSVLPDIPLHLWGVSLRLFRAPAALPNMVTSFDSSSWNRLFGREIEAFRRSGLSQRRWTITVALPWYLAEVSRALAGPKQLSLPLAA